jgi:hypothetical protein
MPRALGINKHKKKFKIYTMNLYKVVYGNTHTINMVQYVAADKMEKVAKECATAYSITYVDEVKILNDLCDPEGINP